MSNSFNILTNSSFSSTFAFYISNFSQIEIHQLNEINNLIPYTTNAVTLFTCKHE